VELTGGSDPDASYTLDPVPATLSQTGASSTTYEVRGIKLTDPNKGANRFAQAAVQYQRRVVGGAVSFTSSTDDANVVLPIDVTQAQFDVTNLNAPSSASVGSTITVTAEVTNIGGGVGTTQPVSFRLGGSTIATKNVTVASGATESVTFNVSTSGLAPGNYTHGVFAAADSQTAQITITGGQPAFQIASVSSPASISQGDGLNVSATIQNVGNGDGSTPVTLNINGTNVSTGTGTVDVAFMIDTSGSMSNEINGIQNGLTDFTNTLQAQGIDVRYAVVTFADQQPYNLRQRYTSNVSQTQQTLNAIQTSGVTERSFDTINGSIGDLNERAGAKEFFIVFTDEDSDPVSSTPSASQIAQRLDSEGISLFAVSPPEPFVGDSSLSVGFLANQTADGQFFNNGAGNFSAKFENQIAGAVANVGAGQQISLNAGANGTVTFSIPGTTTQNLAPGNYTVEVSAANSTANASLQVSSGSPFPPVVAQYDANNDGVISLGEVGQASADYAANQITLGEFGQVAQAFART